MGGLVSGTAILLPTRKESLHTITLTINNQCNLRCPHCYLRYSGSKSIISQEVIDYIFKSESSFSHLAIVGKEPLVDEASASVCKEILSKAATRGMSASLISNGINLQFLDSGTLSSVSFVDISLDGGRIYYPKYRGVSIDRIERNLEWLKTIGYTDYNALEVLNNRTLPYIDDMMEYALESSFSKIMFSQYIETQSEAKNGVSYVSLADCLSALNKSNLFMQNDSAFFIIEIYHCLFEGISLQEARDMVASRGMSRKVYFVPEDPTVLGVMRVTYDGLVMSSFDALHTLNYSQTGTHLKELPDLNQHYRRILLSGVTAGKYTNNRAA